MEKEHLERVAQFYATRTFTMNTKKIIELAKKHLGNGSMPAIAQMYLDDAIQGPPEHARMNAVKSLGYSVGVSHQDYIKARTSVHGGVRPNSGRKALPTGTKKLKISISISPEALQIAQQRHMSVSKFINDLILSSK